MNMASWMAQWVKVTTANPWPELIPGTHIAEQTDLAMLPTEPYTLAAGTTHNPQKINKQM